MADHIHLIPGSPPWEPAGTELVRVLHRYDMPLVGVVRQAGVDYLFQCVAGEVSSFNLWSYTLIAADQLERLESLDASQLGDAISRTTFERPGVVAMAVEIDDTPGLLLSTTYESEGVDAFIEALEELRRKTNQLLSNAHIGDETFDRTLLAI